MSDRNAAADGNNNYGLVLTDVNDADLALAWKGNPTSGAALVEYPTGYDPFQNSEVTAVANPLDKYKVADIDNAAGSVNYYGFLDTSGTWYIMKEDLSANPNTYRYANLSNNSAITGGYSGAGGDKAWANRATLTYDYLSDLTGL